MSLTKRTNMLLSRFSFLIGSDYALGMPSELHIEPTNRCNLSCPLCPRGNGKLSRPIGNMGFEDFKKIVNELSPTLQSILLWNYGEPLLNKDIFKMIRYARNRKISVKLSTNGQMLCNRKMVSSVLESGLDRINMSLDGVTQKTYETYRVGGQISKVIDGIRLLISERNRRNLKYPIVAMEFIVMKHNEHEISKFEDLCKNLGADIISLKTVNIYNNYNLAKKFLPKNSDYSRYADKKGISWKQIKFSRCIRLYDSVMINWDGSVAPCCYDYNGNTFLGNAIKEGVRTVWNGKRFRDLRHRLSENKNIPSLCKKCPGGYPNLWMERKSINKDVKPSF